MGTPAEPNGEVQGGDTPGPNPAWSEVLEIVPEQFHSQLTPHFQQWDQSAQQRIESVNAQLKEFEDYKPFVEHGISKDELEQGVRILYELNNNPRGIYEALANAYDFGKVEESEGGEEEGDEGKIDFSQSPEFAKLQEGLEIVSKIVLEDAQTKEAAQADAELDAELSALREEHGEYDERYVLAMMQNGMSGKEAVEAFNAFKQSIAPQSPAPTILGGAGGNGVPSNAIDPTKLSGKETRGLVAEMLARAAQQQQ